ncbi:universal stress protein [uncultured Winogradskyella sp.]|uniref:universal stress protein n=1 Tax=uncultured Winogradskyella sp. TaxID=395353 RepID=UPI0030ED9949|tara:strand:+ start:495 stop:1295 length:801 start_codon:yes stop_codon:yes gene_type:complete
MKAEKYKILVLSDLKKTESTILKNSVSLAKMIDAEIALFHVKKHIDIVGGDNQLSAIRALNEEHNTTKKTIDTSVKSYAKDYDVTIKGSYAFGKIKEEILKQIKSYKPDVIVLGHRDSNPLQLIGDGITKFVLKEFKGYIMISSDENALIPNKKMTLGVFNDSNKFFNTEFSKDVITHTETPLKSFKIINSQQSAANIIVDKDQQMLEYVFEQNSNALKTLSSFILKNKVNLLCVDRTENKTRNTGEASLREVVNKLNVSLLVSEA